MMFTHLLLHLASMPLTPTPPNVNLTLTVQWVGMDGFPKNKHVLGSCVVEYLPQHEVISRFMPEALLDNKTDN